jgi:tetratricopeptide (TPR) repeat protein
LEQLAPSNEYSWKQPEEQQPASSPEYSWSQSVEQQSASSPEEYSWSQSLEQLAPSNEYSWSQLLESRQQEPQGAGEVLPLGPEETNGWEKPDELYWDGQSGSADNDYTFEAVPPIRTTETASAEPFDKTEQQMLLTLEELEKNLLSDGFVPLEPNWLANLAQEQKASPLPPAEEPQETYAEPPLSSALAELGHFTQQQPQQAPTPPVVEPPIEEEPQVFAQPEPAPEMPLWAASLRPAPLPQPQEKPVVSPPQPSQERPAAVLRPTPVPVPPPLRQQPKPLPEDDFDDGDAPTTHVAAVRPPVKPVVRAIPPKKPSEPVKPTPVTPAARKDVFADMELETTMRRPAIRLQPIQQPPAAPQEQRGGRSHGRSGERTTAGKTAGAETSYQELLLKGYQCQLLGDYDDAMQEYRTVIRNAPDLLGEVISNMRALLKLAPNYSTGYRVLGDAYMRQGEYLQAMEAYNRALTMAKKAKA